MNKVILFNPKSARSKHRIPNSILQVAASIHGKFEYVIVDGNMEKDPWIKIKHYLDTGDFRFFGCTAMPGPQLRQAIPYTKQIRQLYPKVINIWGGYFSSNQHPSVLNSGYVDFVINGPGDEVFPRLLEALIEGKPHHEFENLIYKDSNNKIIKTRQSALQDQDTLPQLPYDYLNQFYPVRNYLGKTFLGKRTAAYHSSMGCPFTCSFCAVVPLYNARWKGKSAKLIYEDVKYLKDVHGADAIEFHDNNFFVSEKRTVEFAKLVRHENISWWGEGRIDTIDKYSDDSLAIMRDAGCRMIFFGAETSNDELLKKMDKGGTQTTAQMKKFAARMMKFDIIPEYSFVLGFPGETPEKVMEQIDRDIAYIKEIKAINPKTEIIIYVYSPVPVEGSEMYEMVKKSGFKFPEVLEDWLGAEWQNFDLRKNPLTPWLTPKMVNKILGFETVLNAQYPTVSDFKVTNLQKKVMHHLSSFRYRFNVFAFPYELKALQKFWLRYRQPEIEGFYQE
ncbi:B12-binding domain-containing radical SAM protein [Pseudochryseolinea flava]|uniref:Radical SAM protein n=1 Tax=Pseudochryseolinea flava TaxID=2059302 RepID=A0A364Y6R8_9BACT|nr:radical SAM protein [Pseudochryseolinea flava]RAW02751.1 radical SAM protein [Pseudochryseolinea flava]